MRHTKRFYHIYKKQCQGATHRIIFRENSLGCLVHVLFDHEPFQVRHEMAMRALGAPSCACFENAIGLASLQTAFDDVVKIHPELITELGLNELPKREKKFK